MSYSLSRAMMLKLNDIIEDRPNEPIEHKINHPEKDLRKMVMQYHEHAIIDSMIEKAFAQVLHSECTIKPHDIHIEYTPNVRTNKIQRSFYRVDPKEISQEMKHYPYYHLTTRNHGGGMKSLSGIQWISQFDVILDNQIIGLPFYVSSIHFTHEKSQTCTLDQFAEKFGHDFSADDLTHIIQTLQDTADKHRRKQLRTHIKDNLFDYLTAKDQETLRRIRRYQTERRDYKKYFDKRNRTAVRQYIRQETRRNGNYEALHPNMESFGVNYETD